jgi:hypothetical protein
MSAIPPLSGDKQTSGEQAKNDASDPKRSFRRHGAHAVAIASGLTLSRAVGDELQTTLHEIIEQSASRLRVQATSSYPATQG